MSLIMTYYNQNWQCLKFGKCPRLSKKKFQSRTCMRFLPHSPYVRDLDLAENLFWLSSLEYVRLGESQNRDLTDDI